MNPYTQVQFKQQLYYRLIALWVICEAFAGGIMHAVKFPFTGLIVSGLSVTCIILIAFYIPSRSAIIKAVIIVALFKLMLSPHSPPTAYIALFFQAVVGHVLLFRHSHFKIAAIVLAVLGLVESAIQRILVLIIVYGKVAWEAMDEFIRKLTHAKTVTNFTLWIALGYICLHAIIGFFVGGYATIVANRSVEWRARFPTLVIAKQQVTEQMERNKKKSGFRIKGLFILIWFVLLALYTITYFVSKENTNAANILLNIILRSVIILSTWYFIVGPLVMAAIKKGIMSQGARYQQEVNEVQLLLPEMRYIFQHSIKLSGKENGFKRIKLFVKILIINVTSEGESNPLNVDDTITSMT